MYIRCLDCQSSTWIESVEPGSKAQVVSCRACGREYTLEVPADLGATQRDQYQKALSFAEGHGIDLPSAYSVLLGIMSKDEARGLREKAASDSTKAAARIAARKARARKMATAPAGPRTAGPKEAEQPPYDPGFRRAVRDGTLTAAQATERGNRKRMATRLARANGLSRKLALEVADNRISLPAALRRQAERKASLKGPRPVRLTPRQRSWVTGILSVAFMLLAVNGVCLWHGYAEEAEAAQGLTETVARQNATTTESPAPEQDRPARTVDPTEVRTDDEGRVLSVAGPNPREVLIRYCRAASLETRLEPVELTSAVPPFPGTRLGIFREHGKPESLLAIRIRRESRSHRWVTGDGSRPIEAFRAPPIPADAQRLALARP
jgi:hypothetical protein